MRARRIRSESLPSCSSEVLALNVSRERNWVSVMNRDLSRAAQSNGWKVDVANLGGPGYSVAQSRMMLQEKGWKLQPQIVMFVFNPWVIVKSTRRLAPEQVAGDPVYVLENGKLVPDEFTRNMAHNSPGPNLWRDRLADLMNRSNVLSLLRMAGRTLPSLVAGFLPRQQAQPRKESDPSPRYHWDPDMQETQESWAITEAFLKEIKAECDLRKVEFWVVVVDRGEATQPDTAKRLELQRSLNLSSLEEIEHRMERFGAANAIQVVSLSPFLGEYTARTHEYLRGPSGTKGVIGHWNELGNELVGHEVARQLLSHSEAVKTAVESDFAIIAGRLQEVGSIKVSRGS